MCPALNWSEDVWAAPGPGSHACLKKIFGPAVRSVESEAMLWLRSIQQEHWTRIGYTPSLPVPGAAPGVSVVDVEHALCEVEKYSRKAFPRIKSAKTEIKAMYRLGKGEGGAPLPVTAHMPHGWAARFGNPAPATAPTSHGEFGTEDVPIDDVIDVDDDDDVVVVDDDVLIVEDDDDSPIIEDEDDDSNLTKPGAGEDGDTYEISHIISELPYGRNSRQYLVRWVGYGPEDDYWMPETALKGASHVLATWRTKQKQTVRKGKSKQARAKHPAAVTRKTRSSLSASSKVL